MGFFHVVLIYLRFSLILFLVPDLALKVHKDFFFG